MQYRSVLRAAIALVLATLAAGSAAAQTLSLDVSPSVAPDLGKVTAAASGDTVFHVATDGSVSVASGAGVRVSRGAVSAPTVTVRCTDLVLLKCAGQTISIRVTAGAATSPAKAIKAFTVAMGTATLNGTVSGSGTSTLSFRLNALNSGESRTFNLGLDLPAQAYTAGTGHGVAGFTVTASLLLVNASDTGQAALTTFRPLSLTKLSDLAFGRVVRPASGAGGVLSVSATGDRAVSGGGVLLSSSFTRAAYQVAGEGGQSVAVDVPASFTMANGAGQSLAVTTSTTAVGLAALSGTAGGDGSYQFYVGGAFPLTPSTPSGSYSGTFPVTVSYD